MKRDCDFSRIDARHDAVNLRLEAWARWVAVRPQAWKMQPMFRLYKPPPQWEPREIRVELNTLECHEIEKIVSRLPDKHRFVLRWAYVFPFIFISKVSKHLGVPQSGLAELVSDARDMVKNRLKQHLRTE